MTAPRRRGPHGAGPLEQTAREVARIRQTEQDNDSTLFARIAAAHAAAAAAANGKVDVSNGTMTAVGLEGGQLNLDPPGLGSHAGWSIDVDASGNFRLISDGVEHLRLLQDNGYLTLRQPKGTADPTAAQSLPGTTTTRISWNTGTLDGVTFNTGADAYGIVHTGEYRVSCNIAYYNNTSDCRLTLSRDVSGTVTLLDADERRESFQSYTHMRVNWRGQLNAGDAVYVDGWASDLSDVASDSRFHFTVERVSI